MATYFISDIHLGLGEPQDEKQKEQRLLSFLKAISPSTERLFILGDLFDFWFEYKTVIPKGFHRTLSALQEFTDHGIPIHYLAGNHDFWMGDFFQTELGIRLHAGPFEISVDGKRVYLHHGDGLSENDLGYKIIKPILRNRFNVWLYRWLHPDIGVKLARGSSRTSRGYTAQKHYGEEKGMIEFATQKIREGVDIVVMGHRHIPTSLPIDRGLYVNLGDWISYNSYGVMVDGNMSLNTWSGSIEQHEK
jgi:UDP-2,3-diacylglucosamine hydrolase